MELKKPIELELIYRTCKNTQRIKEGDSQPPAERFEKTQLLGAFFFTLVILKESNLYCFEDDISKYKITPNITLNEFNHPENTSEIIRHLRNALAHFKIGIKYIDQDNWDFTFTDYIEVDNYYKTKYTIYGEIKELTKEQKVKCKTINGCTMFPHWSMTLSSDDIETFMNNVFIQLHEKYGDQFPFPN